MRSPLGALIFWILRRTSRWEQNNWLEVSHVELTLPNLDREFDGFRLVQISDFHMGTWLNYDRLLEAVQLVNQQAPEIVAITGDFVTFHPEKYTSDIVKALRRLKPNEATVAVLGNHDHWSNARVVRSALREAEVIDVSNTVYTVHKRGKCLHFSGVDDVVTDMADVGAVLGALPSEGAAILLAHEPDFARNSAETERFDLQISGHTHGGQVRLPKIGPIFLPKEGRQFPVGLYRTNGMYHYTNRGLGTAELQFRWNCPAEITVFTLKSPATRPSHPDD